jgi:type VI secretion system protein ImpK
MLEVYYLCILLGFEGKYATQAKSELHLIADRVRQRIERIRGGDSRFSPAGFLPNSRVTVAPADRLAGKLKIAALTTAGAAVVFFLIASVYLFWASSQLRDVLSKALLT